jgi:hypothetical protein
MSVIRRATSYRPQHFAQRVLGREPPDKQRGLGRLRGLGPDSRKRQREHEPCGALCLMTCSRARYLPELLAAEHERPSQRDELLLR